MGKHHQPAQLYHSTQNNGRISVASQVKSLLRERDTHISWSLPESENLSCSQQTERTKLFP